VRDAEDAYRLLHAALEKSGRAGLARWVFHNREYLVSIRALDGVLAMHTMRFHDQLVDPGATSTSASRPRRPATARSTWRHARRLLHDAFKPEDYTDTYREHVLDYLDRSARARRPSRGAEPPPPSDDLMAALEASLKATGKGKG
jgi:DNA end-binding protein Ku